MYKITTSSDGTKKIDFDEGYASVIIPTVNDKYAVCISCQIGCAVGCKFCYTAKMGFKSNLISKKIVEQVNVASSIMGKFPYSIVFMGMGEPILNLSESLKAAEQIHKEFEIAYNRITISTSCLPNIKKLLDIPFNVALSLHSPFDDVRKRLMPATIEIKHIVDFAKEYCKKHPRKELMIEYAMMKGVNDRDEDVKELMSFQWPNKTTFNLIEFNDIDNFKRVSRERMTEFKDAIIKSGYKSFIRYSRGPDIKAACGMLD
ncbi:MAG: radical SAM protein [Nanoarchaeota archaeon]